MRADPICENLAKPQRASSYLISTQNLTIRPRYPRGVHTFGVRTELGYAASEPAA